MGVVARISQQLTAVPQNATPQNAAPVQVATVSPGGRSSTGSATISRAPCEPVAGEHYCKYVVQPGDNLAALATRFNLNGGQVIGLRVLPTRRLARGTQYTVSVQGGNSGVTAEDGRQMPADYQWGFTTSR